jgi:hypothetical protein
MPLFRMNLWTLRFALCAHGEDMMRGLHDDFLFSPEISVIAEKR